MWGDGVNMITGNGKTLGVSAILLILLRFLAVAETNSVAAPPAAKPKLWFPVSEELVYRLYWGFIPVGTSRSKADWVERDGKTMLSIQYRTKTNRIFNKIFPANDFVETIVDPATFLPTTFSLKLQRRRRSYDRVVTFDRENLVANWKSHITGEKRRFAILPDTRDILSFMYFLRSRPPQPREINNFLFVGDEGLIAMRLTTYDVEDVKTPVFGKVPSLLVSPRANFGTLFIEEGKLKAWISTDKRCVLTRLYLKAPLANVKGVLCQVLDSADDSWSRTMRKNKGTAACAKEER